MTSKIIAFILGIAVGAGVCAAVLSGKSRKENSAAVETTATSLSNKIAEVESSLASAKARLRQTEQDNDSLTARVQELLKQKAASVAQSESDKPAKRTGLAALFGGDGTNGMSEAMSSMMKTAAEQQMEGKISGMKAKLNLSAEQEKAIRDILTKQMGMGTEIAQKMFKGELSKEEMEKMAKDQPNQKDQIKAVLTPEQATAYDEFEKDEQARTVRLVANAELLQMQSQLQLDETQQDKVFAVLTEYAMGQLDAKSKDAASALDFRGQFQKKVDALKGVLTPEQLERYQKFQEQQLKMIESFMPKSAPSGAAPASQ